jgi:hypothetical protein
MVRIIGKLVHRQYTPYLFPLAGTAVAVAAPAFYVGQCYSTPVTAPFVLFMAAVVIWPWAYTLELAKADLPTALFWFILH